MGPRLVVVDGQKITWVRDLSGEEHRQFEKASHRLIQHSDDQQLFTIVTLNHADFQNLLQKYALEYEANSSINWLRMEMMRLQINRHMLNFLSAVRTFLDHSEYNLKRRYGDKSKRVERFENACSAAYDTYFSYRFVYELRNYAQHCDMPLGSLKLQSRSVKEGLKTVEHSLSIYFDRDKLLQDDWKAELRAEIQKLPSEFEINPHITQMMKCLESINLTIFEDDLKELDESVQVIEKLTETTKGMIGRPFVMEGGPIGGEKNVKMRIGWIPLELADLVRNVKRSRRKGCSLL